MGKKEYIAEYQKTHYKLVAVKFRRDTDKDIIEPMVASGNCSEFCKRAMREYIKNGGK